MLKILLFVLLLCYPATGVFAQETAADSSDAYETRHYTLLELPQKLWNVLIYPLGQFTIYAEREELPKQVRNWFTNEDHTFGLFPYVQLGGETGTGGGFNTFHTNLFGRKKELAASYVFAHSEKQTGQAFYYDPGVAGSKFYWSADARFLKTDNENATVNGALVEEIKIDASDEEVHLSRFRIKRIDALATLGWRSHAGELEDHLANLYLEGRIGYGRRDLGLKLGPDRPLPDFGSTPQASSFADLDKTVSLFSIGGQIAYDNRDYKKPVRQISHPLNYTFPGRVLLLADEHYYSFRDISFPERGGLVQAEGDFVTGSNEVRFLRIGAEVQRFFTLFWHNRILALRGRLDKVHRIGDDSIVPYADLPTMGGSQRMRGYERGRFRGEGALLFSAEYRYPVWDTWNAFLFWDEGQIFDEFDQLEMDGFHSSFGTGISLRTEEAFLISLRIGHSEEQKALVGFSLEQEF